MRTAIICAAMLAPILLAGCQRDDEIQLGKQFASCKLDAAKAVVIDYDPEMASNERRGEYVGHCMPAAGYHKLDDGCSERHLYYWNDPELCFDNGSHLVPTKYQQQDRKLFRQWQWIK